MKKLISLLLAMVLMASMFAMLGTLTASAETYMVGKELVNLTFEGDAPYGIPANRKTTVKYHPDQGYATLPNPNGGLAFFGKDGTVGYPSRTQESAEADREKAYNDLFKFESGKTYRITLDFKYLAGTQVADPEVSLSFWTNPLISAADGNRGLDSRVNVITKSVPKIKCNLTDGVLAEDTDWATLELVFSVKEGDTCVFGMYGGYNLQKSIITAIDNFKVEEIFGYYSYDESFVTMDETLTWKNASGAPGEIVKNYDAEHGNVLKVSGTANTARGSFVNDQFVVENGKKYYISFDAKADATGTINTCFTQLNNTTGFRYFFTGYNIKYNGVKYYVDGVEKTVNDKTTNAEIFPVTTEWATYGLIVDTNDEGFKNGVLSIHESYKTFWNGTINFAFGATETAYFDNFKIVEMTEPATTVVPAADASAKYSIREESANKTAGLRFKGDVAASVKATADEIGFVIAPIELVIGEENWYKVDSLNKNAKKVVAYNGTKDVVYEEKADAVSYQLVLTNLGNLASRRFAAVMYVKTGDTYSYISLGEISYNQVLAEYAVRGK